MLLNHEEMLTYYTARELTLDAAQGARSSRGATKTLPAAQIKKLLDSRNDREVLDGLRKVTSVCSAAFGRIHRIYANTMEQARLLISRL